jgi:chromosomal replication initiator protein
MELTADELWSRILDAARSRIPEQGFRTWVAGATVLGLSGDELLLEAPSEFHVQWLEDKYGDTLADVARQIVGRPVRISARARAGGPTVVPTVVPTVELTPPSATHEARPGSVGSPRETPRRRPLNERYTFDRFVVGSGNQLAVAGARAVAEKPARLYNPLFLYGGVGLGKTHLMHAIGNYIVENHHATGVAYVPSEQFTNELVMAIQEGKTADFRRRYRQMDLLLVDDVHFLEGKERTQEEFFHTFNALHDAHRQIVLTSDRPPKDIPGLEERLVSRFEWGLVADVKPPDYETRIAILRKKAADDGLVLDEDVIDFIARSCTSSVRELEGAVIKLLAYSSLKNEEITLELARTSIHAVLKRGEPGGPPLTPELIREATAETWGVEPMALTSKRRTKDLTVPRQVAMYLIKEILGMPLVQIGRHFGGRDHSTVHHSIQKVEKQLETDDDFRLRVEGIAAELRKGV